MGPFDIFINLIQLWPSLGHFGRKRDCTQNRLIGIDKKKPHAQLCAVAYLHALPVHIRFVRSLTEAHAKLLATTITKSPLEPLMVEIFDIKTMAHP